MGVRGGLEDAGSWLVGDTALNPAWLQLAHTAITPQEWFTVNKRNNCNAFFFKPQSHKLKKSFFFALSHIFFCISNFLNKP